MWMKLAGDRSSVDVCGVGPLCLFQCLQPNTTCHTTSPEGGLIALCSTKATLLQHAPMSLPCCLGMLSGVPAFPRGKLWHNAGFSLAVSFFRVTLDEANMMFLALVQWSHNRFEHYILYKGFFASVQFFLHTMPFREPSRIKFLPGLQHPSQARNPKRPRSPWWELHLLPWHRPVAAALGSVLPGWDWRTWAVSHFPDFTQISVLFYIQISIVPLRSGMQL